MGDDELRPLELDAAGAWLREARHTPSPNCDARPPGAEVELVVVHGISLPPGRFGGPHIERFFTNRLDPQEHPYFAEIAGARVSAHALVRRDGEIVQFVPFTLRAWHAGKSAFQGRGQCNDFSVGIELEGSDEQAYESVQYRMLARLVAGLMRRWPAIRREHVVGHCDVAPGRKTDPGPAFRWQILHELVDEALQASISN